MDMMGAADAGCGAMDSGIITAAGRAMLGIIIVVAAAAAVVMAGLVVVESTSVAAVVVVVL